MVLPPESSPPPLPATDAWRAAGEGAVFTDATGFGLVAFDGADAATFLQGQLSNDVAALAPGQGQRTTYNSPKGRMLATLFLWREPGGEGFRAVAAEDLVPAFARRIAMFVLRAKVTVRAFDGSHVVLGVGGPHASATVREAFGVDVAASQAANVRASTIVHLPEGRFLVVAPVAERAGVEAALAAHAARVDAETWRWLGIRAGVPLITTATQDRFVAQTANQDALQALDFRKGCYTGQEIVARTHYLGRLKERLYAFETDAVPPAPGTSLYGEPFGEQAAGTVVDAVADPSGGSRFLAVAQVQAAQRGTLAVGAPDGTQARVVPLPYDLPEPTPPRRMPRG